MATRKKPEADLKSAHSSSKKSGQSSQSHNAEDEVETFYSKVALVESVPIPDENFPEWDISLKMKHRKKGMFDFIKRKKCPAHFLTEMRSQVEKSPGATKVMVMANLKKHPEDPDLYALSALSTKRMLMKGTSAKDTLEGLKHAVQDAVLALLYEGMSLYNAELFFKVYYYFLDQLIREQVKLVSSVHRQYTDLHEIQRLSTRLRTCIHEVEFLLAERKRFLLRLSNIKSKIISSHHTQIIHFQEILGAIRLMEIDKGNLSHGLGTAQNTLSTAFSLLSLFCRVPILGSFIATVLEYFPRRNFSSRIRYAAIHTDLMLTQLRVLGLRNKNGEMRALSQKILRENFALAERLQSHPIQHSYDAAPLLNMARIVEASMGIFSKKNHSEMAAYAIKYMRTVQENDTTRERKYARTAERHLIVLNGILDTYTSSSLAKKLMDEGKEEEHLENGF